MSWFNKSWFNKYWWVVPFAVVVIAIVVGTFTYFHFEDRRLCLKETASSYCEEQGMNYHDSGFGKIYCKSDKFRNRNFSGRYYKMYYYTNEEIEYCKGVLE